MPKVPKQYGLGGDYQRYLRTPVVFGVSGMKAEIKPTKKLKAEPEPKRRTWPWKKRGGEHQSKAEAKK